VAKPLYLYEIMESACRIEVRGASGSGTTIFEDKNSYYILTNAHVVGQNTNASVEWFLPHGYKTNKIPGIVIWKAHQNRTDIDLAIIKVNKSSVGKYKPRIIPLVPDGYVLKRGMHISTAGCPGARWLSIREGMILENSGSRILFMPSPVGGQSGSGVIVNVRDKNGEQHSRVGAVLTWGVGNSGRDSNGFDIQKSGGVLVQSFHNIIKGRKVAPQTIPPNYIEIATKTKNEICTQLCQTCSKCIHQHATGSDGNKYCTLIKPDGSKYIKCPQGVSIINFGSKYG
jgi:hypothetical protein